MKLIVWYDPATEEGRRQIVRRASRWLNPARHPCSVCGWHKAERHHPTYDSLAVVWLCRKHHNMLHNKHIRPRHPDGKYKAATDF